MTPASQKSAFPFLSIQQRVEFPALTGANKKQPVACGGNLSPGMLLSAYEQGLFPWSTEGDSPAWWSPDPRFCLTPAELRLPKRLGRFLKKEPFSFSFDHDFPTVITLCAGAKRKNQPEGTWITQEVLSAYLTLHQLGFAHSLEVWQDKKLVGGLYGVSLGRGFFGESMFSLTDNASRAGFVFLAQSLAGLNFTLLDCQIYSSHLAQLGAVEIPRRNFLSKLRQALQWSTLRGSWSDLVLP